MWHEASPPLFLWLERAVTLVLGDSTYALRLIPLVGELPVGRAVHGRGAATATAGRGVLGRAAVAVSDRLLWHACEAKPYAVDVCLATAVLFGMSATRAWPLAAASVAMIAVAPFMIFLSYPACFLCGAVLLAVAAGSVARRAVETAVCSTRCAGRSWSARSRCCTSGRSARSGPAGSKRAGCVALPGLVAAGDGAALERRVHV